MEKKSNLTVFDSERGDLSLINEEKVFNFFVQKRDALAEVMYLLTDGKTTEFDPQVMIDALSVETLLKAVKKNSLKLVEFCLIAGLSPDGMVTSHWGESKNLLTIAIRENYNEMVDLLLRYGANPNGSESLKSVGHPLLAAVEKKDLGLVKKLLSLGANPKASICVSVKEKQIIDTERYNSREKEPAFENICMVNYTNILKRAMEIYYEEEKDKVSEISAFLEAENRENFSHSSEKVNKSENADIKRALPVSCEVGFVQEKRNDLDILLEQQVSSITAIIYNLIKTNPDCLDNMLLTEIRYASMFSGNIAEVGRYNEDEAETTMDSCLVLPCSHGDLAMTKFLLSKGAKLRKKENLHRNPIIDIEIECPKPKIETEKSTGYRYVEEYVYLIKDTSQTDEVLAAIRGRNAELLDFLIKQGAFVKYLLCTDDGKQNAVRGITEAVENDDENMAAVLMHHGTTFSDKTYFYPLSYYKENKRGFNFFSDRRRDKDRLLKVENIMDDPSKPKIYAMYKENGFEKRYQMLQKIWGVRAMIENQKRIEEEKQKLLENQSNQLLKEIKRLPYDAKINPRGKEFLLIQELALMGGLYLAAKEEPIEVVNAWIPIFERVISKETMNDLLKRKECEKRSNMRQIG